MRSVQFPSLSSWFVLCCVALVGGACGDDSSDVCGPNTSDINGVCVADGTPNGRPASLRLCDTAFGPVGSEALLVSADYSGSDGDGSEARPFASIQAAIDAASAGQEIGVGPGNYAGDLTISKPVHIEGRCAAEVTVTGTISVSATGGVALRGITVTGGTPGILATDLQPEGGDEFGMEIRYVIATDNTGAGIEMNASSVRIRDSEFTLARQVANGDLRQLGSGIFINNGSFYDIRTSIAEMNGFIGIDVADATGQPTFNIDGGGTSKAVATTPSTGIAEMNGIIGNMGGGMRVLETDTQLIPNATAPTTTISGNTFEGNTGFAIQVNATRVDILANDLKGAAGATRGIVLASATGTLVNNRISDFPTGGVALGASASLSIVGNTLSNNTEVGILSHNSKDITLNSNTITGTVSATTPLASGHGIYIYADPGAPAQLLLGRHFLSTNQVTDNAGVGIGLESLTRGDAAPSLFEMFGNTISRNGFAGINLQNTHAGVMTDNVLDGNTGFGVRCMEDLINPVHDNSRVFFDGNTINGTTAVAKASLDGDAVLASHCHVSFDLNTITANARYGLYFANGSTGGCDFNMVVDHTPADIMDADNSMGIGDNGVAVELVGGALGANLDPVTGPSF